MTYICKNHDFSDTEIYHLNKFRIHCNRIRQNRDIPSYEDYLYDLKSLSDFIAKYTGDRFPKTYKECLPHATRSITPADYAPDINIRITVSSWDKDFITGYTEDDNSVFVKIDYHKYAQNNDLDYIADLLAENTQLYLLKHEKSKKTGFFVRNKSFTNRTIYSRSLQ